MPRRLSRAIALHPFLGLLATAALAWPAAAWAEETAPDPEADSAEARGAYVLRAANCVTCHTAPEDDAAPLAGGRALETPFGTFHTPNLTPDPTGIGGWSEDDFVRALREGVSPEGAPYYPAFPYTSYAGMTESDAQDIFAYLRSLEPVKNAVAAHDLDVPYAIRQTLHVWRWLHFDGPAPFEADTSHDAQWNRGAYLVDVLGHCGECHTPRGSLGATRDDRHLAGTSDGPEGRAVPNITPHPEDGIGGWSRRDITFFLETGFYPDGDVAGSGMGAVVQDSTRHLSDEDREAIAAYLLSLPPLSSD